MSELPVIGIDGEGFALLSVFDSRRCGCQLGYCGRAATADGLCDRCFMEYAAARNVYLGPGEWH